MAGRHYSPRDGPPCRAGPHGGFTLHGPPRTPGIPDRSDDGEGDNEISLQGWEIEIVGGEETGGEDRISSAMDIILAAAARTRG